jgi:hypothetical protein
MAMPASGAINFGQLQTEFGGSNPIGLNEYYKGGTYVPNIAANAAVPTSGAISLSNFYSARRLDVTPTAINWIDTSGNAAFLPTTNQTIAGIDTSITLQVTYSSTLGGTCSYRINSGTYIALTSGDTFGINLSDTLQFRTTRGAVGDVITVSITNSSDGGAAIDSFTATHA